MCEPKNEPGDIKRMIFRNKMSPVFMLVPFVAWHFERWQPSGFLYCACWLAVTLSLLTGIKNWATVLVISGTCDFSLKMSYTFQPTVSYFVQVSKPDHWSVCHKKFAARSIVATHHCLIFCHSHSKKQCFFLFCPKGFKKKSIWICYL